MVSFLVDLYSFSPNGLYLACLIQAEKRILVRSCGIPFHQLNSPCQDKHTFLDKEKDLIFCESVNVGMGMKVIRKYSLEKNSSPVDILCWSPDSKFISLGCKKYAVLNIFSVEDPTWECKVSLGTLEKIGGLGLENFWWGRDGRHILCLTGESAYLGIWSIRREFVQYLKNFASFPSHSPCFSYSSCGGLLACAHVDHDANNLITIYSTESWKKLKSFPLRSRDLAGISWQPGSGSSGYLAAWDSPLFSNLYIYQISSGEMVKQYSPYGMSSSGFDLVQWSPCGTFLVCTAQNKNDLHVINGLTFGVLIHDVLEPSYSFGDLESGTCQFFYEQNSNDHCMKFQRLSRWPSSILEQMTKCHLKVHASPWGNTTHAKIQSHGRYLACRTHIYPHILWIYDLHGGNTLAVVIYSRPVSDLDWHPLRVQLAILSSSSSASKPRQVLSYWTPSKGSYSPRSPIIAQSKNLLSGCRSLEWSPLGDMLLLRNEDFSRVHMLPVTNS